MLGHKTKLQRELAREKAAHWYALLSEEPTSVPRNVREQFCVWLRESPDNVAELLEVSRMHRRMRRVRLVVRPVHLLDRKIVPFPRETSRTPVRRLALTASFVPLAALALLVVFLVDGSTGFRSHHNVETQTKQIATVPLDDGSIVHLSPNSRVEIDFTSDRRLVHLLAGEAVFDVHHDTRRPFTVRTYLIDVTAVGTRFGVRVEHGVMTTVQEGVIKVTPRNAARDAQAVRVKAGEGLESIETKLSSPKLRSVDAERTLAWASGRVILRNSTLAEAAAAFNRFNDIEIVYAADLAQRQLPYYRFGIHEPEEFAKAVAAAPDVELAIDREQQLLELTAEKPAQPEGR